MKQKQSGFVESKISDFFSQLDETIRLIGFSNTKNDEAIQALNLTYEQLKKIEPKECLILCYSLNQYALYIQTLQNRAENIKKWIEHNLNVIYSKHLKDYSGYIEEKKMAINNENTYANELYQRLLTANAKLIELQGISQKISQLSYTLSELAKVKRYV